MNRFLDTKFDAARQIVSQHVGLPFFFTDTRGSITFFSEAAKEILVNSAGETGLSPASLCLRENHEIQIMGSSPASRDELQSNPGFQELVAGITVDHPRRSQWTLVKPDGERATIELTMGALVDADGTIVGFLGLPWTDSGNAAPVRDELHQFETLFKYAPDAKLILDENHHIKLLNHNAEEMFGFEKDELLDRPVETVIAEKSQDLFFKLLKQKPDQGFFSAKGFKRNDLFARHHNGNEFPVDFNINPIRIGSESVTLVAARDISERVQWERQIGQTLALLDSIDEGAFVFDPESLRLTYANQGAVKQLGYTLEEFQGMSVLEFKQDFDESTFSEAIAPLINEETDHLEIVTHYRDRTGHVFPVEVSLKLVEIDNQMKQFIAIARNISDRIEQEKHERRAQRLESIGTLAGGLAHDLNNTLAPIILICELLKERYPQETEMLSTVEVSAKRGADLISQLLVFAKGAEGQKLPVAVEEILTEVVQMMKGTLPKNIEIRSQIEPGLPKILGDPTQIHQVLVNLCVNARDAMPDGGVMGITASRLEVDTAYASTITDAHPGTYVSISVTDTGYGISPENYDRIFDPFFSTKDPDKGTGMGLSTVIGIVKGQNGFLRFESELGSGSTFVVNLPADFAGESEGTDDESESGPAFSGEGRNILFVDDEPLVRNVAKAVLEANGFSVSTASDGAEGLIALGQGNNRYSAVICDVNMPNLGGLGFVRALRKTFEEIPVMVTSGLFLDADVAEFHDLGINSMLCKPYSEGQLLSALEELIS